MVDNPYLFYHQLRETSPVYQMQQGRWLISRYANAVSLLNSPQCDHWGQNLRDMSRLHPTEAALAQCLQVLAPNHAVPFRQAVHSVVARALNEQATAMTHRADALLQSLRDRPHIDAMADYAHPFTFGSISQVIGVPEADISALSEVVGRLQGNYLSCVSAENQENLLQGDGQVFVDYLHRLLEEKRRAPQTDLISQLIQVAEHADPDVMSEAGLINLLILLFYAGHQNMMNFIGNALLALFQHPDSCTALRQDPALMDKAIIELLRFDSPVQYILLIAREAITLRSQVIAPGEEILIGVGAANRDPEVFENPDQLDIHRRPTQHLAFGAGIFRCIGAQLAQRQGGIALSRFLAHITDFQVADEPLRWRTTPMVQRGLYALPLAGLNYG